MSELLDKVFCDEIALKEVLQWLSKNDVETPKYGVSQSDFSRFLLEFLRKHTCLLLPVPEPATPEKCTENTETPNTSINDRFNSFGKSPGSTFSSPLSESSFPTLRSPNNTDDRYKYPLRSPFHTPPANDKSFSTLKSEEKKSPIIRGHSTPSPKPLQLGDFMVIKRKTPKQKVKKRIQLVSPGNDGNDLLGNECNDVLSQENSSVKPESSISDSIELLKPKEEHRNLIEKLAFLYSAAISSNLTLDLLKELNYVMSLLTNDCEIDSQKFPCHCSKSQRFPTFSSTAKEICLFKTSSEGIYFACVVLENQWSLLKYLNKSTLSILSENSSVRTYAPQLREKIVSFINKNKNDSQNVNILNREILAETVKFKIDTDSRPNYANNESFYAFKKQRDEFYSLLHEWQECYTQQPSTEFFKAKYKRLRSIFTTSSAITNMSRLADLFVSQILASVFNENAESSDKSSSGGVAMTKFDLLNKRFVTPCSIVVGTEKRFPGVQEFFKDFLRSAENSFFFTHVQNELVHRIVSLNNFQFSCEVAVALQKQELFLTCINKLCLLAKFLSLITFLPYQDEYDLPLHLRLPLTEVRKEIQPPLDLDGCLTESMNSGRMMLTIPWIVEFLNGIDNTSTLLPYYGAVFAKLQYLLYKLKLPFSETLVHDGILLAYTEEAKEDKKGKIEKDLKTIKATEIRNLLTERRNEFSERFVDECLQTINCSQILITLYVNSLFNNVPVSAIIKSEDVTDLAGKCIIISSEFYIGETALYQCCPHLHELKHLLEGGKRLSYKSVIPKMEKSFCEQGNDPKAVDVLLEMHLFDNLPKSVKNSVDFVAERIASLCVKSIRQEIIPSLKNELLEEMKKIRDKRGCAEGTVVDYLRVKFYAILKSGVKKELSKFYNNVEASVKALIEAEVTDDTVINICIDISCRKCVEIVYNWIFNYINVEDIIKKNESIKGELARMKMTEEQLLNEKKSKKSKSDVQRTEFQEWASKRSKTNANNNSDPVKILHNLRHLIRVSIGIFRNDTISSADIVHTLRDSYKCVKYSPDLQFVGFRRIMILSLELCTILVFFHPNVLDDDVMEKFGALWSLQKICSLQLPFEHVFSYRNMEYFYAFYSQRRVSIRNAMTRFLIYTINSELLPVKRLFSQILRLGRREWSNELLVELSICLNEVLENTQSGQEKIKSALQWLADFMAEDNNFF